jgi:ATP-dependent Clp protease protease subunit
MSKPSLRVVKNEAQQSADIFIYGIIGDFWSDSPVTARSFQQQLAALSDYPTIHVHINSPGGDVMEGLAICNTILASKKDIHTWNDGIAASMGAAILCSAEDGKRHAAKGSLTMLHSASTICWGNSEEMLETADMLSKFDDVLAEIIADAAGLTPEQAKTQWMDGDDHWFTAKEAEAAGLVTIEDYSAQELPENATAMKMDKVAAFYNPNSKITNTNNMGLLSNKFKSISALGKTPAAERTAVQFKAVNDELEAEGITGATLIADADLAETIEQADKVPALETQVTDLNAEKSTLTQEVTDLKATVAAQAKELGKPAVDAKSPVTIATDSTGEKPVVNAFETSFDKELKARMGK